MLRHVLLILVASTCSALFGDSFKKMFPSKTTVKATTAAKNRTATRASKKAATEDAAHQKYAAHQEYERIAKAFKTANGRALPELKTIARCHEAMSNPVPSFESWRSVGYKRADWRGFNFWSQYKQDHILWTEHYSLRSNRDRVYVDVGTNHPSAISNTFFFDKCLGWKGICVEPQRHYYAPLLRDRTCEVISTCISSMYEEIEYSEAGVQGGITRTNGAIQPLAPGQKRTATAQRASDHVANAPKTTMTCVPLEVVLKRRGVRHVDVMNLDAEGHELPVLQSIDWNYTTIDVLLVEPVSMPFTHFLRDLGYWYYFTGTKEHPNPTANQGAGPKEIWIHRRVKWGQPGDYHHD